MSGGRFDHSQYTIMTIADTIESVIERNNVPIDPKEKEPWDTREVYSSYSEPTIGLFRLAVTVLKMGFIHAHQIDKLLSGDTDEEGFVNRLGKELKSLEKELKSINEDAE